LSPPGARQPAHHRRQLISIGASAGGPTALAKVLAYLPGDFPAPVVIVQHVDAQFTAGLANWLDGHTALRVRLAHDGDRPEAGTALLAGQDDHLLFASPSRLAYVCQPLDCAYRPSVDLFFKSANRFWPGDVIAVMEQRDCASCTATAIIPSPRTTPAARLTGCPAPPLSFTLPARF
jgi:two-component system response regulator WspF